MIEPTENTIQEWEAQELEKSRLELSQLKQSDTHDKLLNKFRGFLSMAGEKTSKETGELFREHIPVSVFGVSSDEVASDLGISENELMAKLMTGLNTNSPIIKRLTQNQPRTTAKKQPLGIDFDYVSAISGYRRTIRALGLMTYGDNIVMLAQRYVESKLKKKVFGFLVSPQETLRYLARIQS